MIQNPGFLPDHPQKWTACSLCHARHTLKISERSVHNFLSYLANRQTNRQTKTSKNITSLAEVKIYNLTKAQQQTFNGMHPESTILKYHFYCMYYTLLMTITLSLLLSLLLLLLSLQYYGKKKLTVQGACIQGSPSICIGNVRRVLHTRINTKSIIKYNNISHFMLTS